MSIDHQKFTNANSESESRAEEIFSKIEKFFGVEIVQQSDEDTKKIIQIKS